MKIHKAVYAACMELAKGKPAMQQRVLNDHDGAYARKLIAAGKLCTVPHPGHGKFPVGYYVAKPEQWLVLDKAGAQEGVAHDTKRKALNSLGAVSATLIRPGVYQVGSHTVLLRSERDRKGQAVLL